MITSNSAKQLPENDAEPQPQPPLTILSVEDDQAYQESLLFSLATLEDVTGKLNVLTASSAEQGLQIVRDQQDIALMLLDVVMEDEQAGLRLVDQVRNQIGDRNVRIVLLTGQPGNAPCKQVLLEHDIDDFWYKADLTPSHLATIVRGNLRTWQHLQELTTDRHGLISVVRAARHIGQQRDIQEFTQSVLEEINLIVAVGEGGGIACLSPGGSSDNLLANSLIATSGCYLSFQGKPLHTVEDEKLLWLCRMARKKRQHMFAGNLNILFFGIPLDGDKRQKIYLVAINSPNPLSDREINLLQVFVENVASGFRNLLLLQHLSDLAFRDPVLGINNRNWMIKQLSVSDRSQRQEEVLLLLRIDHFNDMAIAFGENYCKLLLREVHLRLSTLLPQGRTLALLANDEFAVLMDNQWLQQPDNIQPLRLLAIEHESGKHAMSLTAAAIPLAHLDKNTPAQLVRLAESLVDIARQHCSGFMLYAEQFGTAISRRHDLLHKLRDALEFRELYVELQPKLDLTSDEIIGFEALARWRDSDGTLISPVEFIPVAETAGLIHLVGQQILEDTIQVLQLLLEEGFQLPIAFNISCSQLLHAEHVDMLIDVIRNHGVDPELLEIEITESQSVANYEQIKQQLQRFVDLGIKISLDDFGTGYCSLAHISHLHADTLKIDRVFIEQMSESNVSEDMVDIILRIGKRYGYKVLAEGISKLSQLEMLRAKGCRYGQGFYYAKPMTSEKLIAWLKARNSQAGTSKA